MSLIDLEATIEKLPKEQADLKPILKLMVNAINTLFDTKHIMTESVVFVNENTGIEQRRQGVGGTTGDGNWVRQLTTGSGSSALTFIDLGKERKG